MKYNNLHHVLKKRYNESRLANLYTLQYDSHLTNPDLWVSEFLATISSEPFHSNDHPDVLSIKRLEEENDYKVDGANWTFFHSFIQYKPLKLKNKFVFIHDADRLSDILSNKLLKTFEDTPKELTIFLFLKDQRNLLATIASRSIQLKIQHEHHTLKKVPVINLDNPIKIIDEMKSNDDGEAIFINNVIDQILAQNPSYEQISKTLEEIKSFEKCGEFNNSLLSRIALILP